MNIREGTSYGLDEGTLDQPRGAHSMELSIVYVASSSRSDAECVWKPRGLGSRLNLRMEADETLISIWRWATGTLMLRLRRPFERLDKVSSPSSSSLGSVNETSVRSSPSGWSSWGMIGRYLMRNGHNSIQLQDERRPSLAYQWSATRRSCAFVTRGLSHSYAHEADDRGRAR